MPLPEPSIDRRDFERSGWEGVIASAPRKTCRTYANSFLRALAQGENGSDAKTAEVFELLVAVTSLELRTDSPGEPFAPANLAYAGSSWTIEDLADPHLDLLAELAPGLGDAELRARLADVLWVRRRAFPMAVLAVRSYLESARVLEEDESSLAFVDRVRRARDLAASLGRGQRELFKAVLRAVEEALERLDVAVADFRSVRLLEILADSDPEDPERLARWAERLAAEAERQARWRVARHLWELGADFYRAASAAEEQRAARINAAETYVKEAEATLQRTGGGYLAAAHHLKRAVEAMRRIEGMGERSQELHKKLLDYQREGSSEMEVVSASAEATEIVMQSERRVSGKDLTDALLALSFIVSPTDVEQLRQTVREQFRTYIGMSLLPIQTVNERGMTVGITPSTAPDGLSGEELQVLAEMYNQVHRVHNLVSTQGLIEPAKRVILREHRIAPEAFYDFVSNNPLVPAGREYIFARGLSEWIHGDLLVATHLLVPQLENSLRTLLEHAGVATTSLSSEGLQGDRMLGSILAADELEQLLGKGTVFDLKCLLIERFGANLRNLMAHGLAEHASMYSPSASYLCWMVLHLCARSVQARATENGGVEDESED